MKSKLFAIVIQIVIVLIIIILITFIIRESERYKLRKRISKYTINKNNNNISIYDKVISNYNNVLKKLRTPIKKVLPTLVKRYDKYVIGEGCGEDIITNKFVLALTITVLYIIVSIFKKVKISLLFILLVFIIGFYIYDIILIIIKKIRYNDMLRAVIIMNNAFKSGKSTIQAVKIVSEKLDGTLKYEFKKIYSEMCYGLTIESAFDRFSKRVKVESSVYISSSLITLSKTGGNIVKVFDSIEKTLYDKKKLESELKSTTMVSNLVVKILMIIPLVNVFLLYILNPSYFSPLFESPLGYFVIFIIVMLFTIYVIVLNRMLKVKY